MSIRRYFLGVLLLLLLTGPAAWAQTRPATAPPAAGPPPLVVRVTLPTVVGVISDYASVLTSGKPGKLKAATARRDARTSNPVVTFTVPLAENSLIRKLLPKE